MSKPPINRSEQIGRTMLGMADLLELVVTKLREFGADLIARAKSETSINRKQMP